MPWTSSHTSSSVSAGKDSGKGFEVRAGAVGDHLRQRGLAGSGRSPQDDGRKEAVGLDGAAQEFPGSDYMLLPDILLQGARAHTGGKRCLAAHLLLHGMVKEVWHGRDYKAFRL